MGKQQADEVLVRVPLRLYEKANITTNDADGDLENAPSLETQPVVGVLKELNETCSEYQREATRRTICRVSETISL
jgi:nuclear pore complex protein Nup85